MHHQIDGHIFIVLYIIVVLLIPFSIYFSLTYMERRGKVLSPKANAWMINSLRVGLFILIAIVMGIVGFLMNEIGIWKVYLPLLAIGLLSIFIHLYYTYLSKKGKELFGMTKKMKEITLVVGLAFTLLPTFILLFLLFDKIGIFGIIIIIGLLGAIPKFIIKGKF